MEKLIISVKNKDGVTLSISNLLDSRFKSPVHHRSKAGVSDAVRNDISVFVVNNVYPMKTGDELQFLTLSGSPEKIKRILDVINVIEQIEK